MRPTDYQRLIDALRDSKAVTIANAVVDLLDALADRVDDEHADVVREAGTFSVIADGLDGYAVDVGLGVASSDPETLVVDLLLATANLIRASGLTDDGTVIGAEPRWPGEGGDADDGTCPGCGKPLVNPGLFDADDAPFGTNCTWIETTSSPGFAGPIYITRFACGYVDADLSADNAEAAR